MQLVDVMLVPELSEASSDPPAHQFSVNLGASNSAALRFARGVEIFLHSSSENSERAAPCFGLVATSGG